MMTKDEFNAHVEEELSRITDTDENRKRKQLSESISNVKAEIAAKEKEVDSLMNDVEIDSALEAKGMLEQMKEKMKILQQMYSAAMSKPTWNDKELTALRKEIREFHSKNMVSLYKERLSLLQQMDENFEKMEAEKKRCDETLRGIEPLYEGRSHESVGSFYLSRDDSYMNDSVGMKLYLERVYGMKF